MDISAAYIDILIYLYIYAYIHRSYDAIYTIYSPGKICLSRITHEKMPRRFAQTLDMIRAAAIYTRPSKKLICPNLRGEASLLIFQFNTLAW